MCVTDIDVTSRCISTIYKNGLWNCSDNVIFSLFFNLLQTDSVSDMLMNLLNKREDIQ